MRNKLTVRAALALAMAFTFSCSGNSDDNSGGNGGSTEQSACNGQVSNSCPNGSSPSEGGSSSSVANVGSSSSVNGGSFSGNSSGAYCVLAYTSQCVTNLESMGMDCISTYGNNGKLSDSCPAGYKCVHWNGPDKAPTSVLNCSTVPPSSSSQQQSSSSIIPSSSSEYTGGSCNISDYGMIEIGYQVWMAKNWGCYVPGSKCYNNDPANCTIYGRLYDWATAMGLPSKCNSTLSTSDADCAIATPHHRGICPSGWHIPSAADWNVLMKVADPSCSDNNGCAGVGTKLKAQEGWNDYDGVSGNGTDALGFSALPGGVGDSNGNFDDAGDYGYWWGASEYYADYAYYRYMYYSSGNAGWYYGSKSYNQFSVRCLKD